MAGQDSSGRCDGGAAPSKTPKLAVTTNLSNESFAAMLDRAIARSQAPPKQIEHRPDETAGGIAWSGPLRHD